MSIVLERLSKSYPSTGQILDKFSTIISTEALTFITGPNGIGKTVLAECFVGLRPLDSGTLEIDGKTYSHENWCRSAARDVGIEYLPQRLPRPDNLSGYELLSLALPNQRWLFRKAVISREVKAIIGRYGLEFDLPLEQPLSTMMPEVLQQLYITKALLSNAKVLVMDEPTAHLAEADATRFGYLLKHLVQSGGITLIVIAHPQQHAMKAGQANTKTFTRTGLLDGLIQKDLNIVGLSERIKGIGDWDHYLELAGEGSLDVGPGDIVTIVGDSSAEFHRLGPALSNGNYLTSCRREGEIDGETPLIRFIPSDGSNSKLVNDMDLLNNCLIDHWHNAEWNIFKYFINYKYAEYKLVNRITSQLRIEPADSNTALKHLSGGNRQRLLIGRSYFGNLDLLVAHGLLKGLDDEGVQTVLRLLLRRACEGVVTILLCHGGGVEVDIADTVLYFYNDGIHRTSAN